MSVLYSLTLRTNNTTSTIRKRKLAFRFIFFFLIASFLFQETFGQDEKEIQIRNRREAKLNEQNPANPSSPNKQILSGINDEKKAAAKREAEKAAKIKLDKSRGVVLPGIEYKVVTLGSLVEYVVTNAGREIYRQQINTPGNVYEKQIQAEKEAIYASNTFRRNINYPANTLQAEIRGLVENKPVTRTVSGTNTQRINADYTFNGGSGIINAAGAATPYPATITVSGVPAGATVKSVKINGLDHTYASDVDILLQSPTGVNVFLMSDVGGFDDFVNDNYSFEDGAATNMGTTHPSSGSYKPTNLVGTLGPEPDNFVAPGPGALSQANPTLSLFGSGNHNGTWNLYVLDDFSGDAGNWDSWSIVFTDPIAVCFPITITSSPANTTICSGANGSFSVTATPAGVNYNWQVNTGSGFTYLTNGGVYSGVNTATLNITGALTSMNGYQYRCVVICPQGGLPEISNSATLTVIASPAPPVIVPTPSSANICPGGNVKMEIISSTSDLTVSSGPISVTIPDNSTGTAINDLAVSGFAGTIGAIRVNFNIEMTFDGDLKINLKAPNGSILNLVNQRGGGGDNFVNTTINSVSGLALSAGVSPFTGVFVADAASAVGIAPNLSNTTTFSSLFTTANGTWSLILTDHAGGDVGKLLSWSITLVPTGASPDNAIWSPIAGLFNDAALSSPYVAGTSQSIVYASPAATQTYTASVSNGTCGSSSTQVVTVNAPPVITTQPGSGNACVGLAKSLSVSATGTSLTYQWQVDMGSGFVNITTGTPTNPSGFIYTGQTSSTLSINSVMATMNGYKYRVNVAGNCTPVATSNEVTLTVNNRPAVVVSKTSTCSPTTLTASGADTYSWSPSTGLSASTGATVTANPTANTIYTVTGTTTATGCTNTTQVDVKFTPGTPTVSPAAPIICAGTAQPISITSSTASSTPPAVSTTASGTISLPIGNLLPPAISNINVSGITGAVQSISVNFNITHTYDGDMTINLKAPNGAIYNLAWEVGGSGDNFVNTTISSTGVAPIFGGTAPFTGTYAGDGFTGVGIAPNLSTTSAWSGLYSTPNGAWSLIVTDPWSGDEGTLTSWSITITYAVPDAGIWTPVTGLFTNAAATIPYVAGTPATTVYANPSATTTYSVTVGSSSTERRTFSSGGSVTIPAVAPGSTAAGAGAPYASTIAVAGLPTNATVKSVVIRGLRHSNPDDIDMLLQSPTGTNVVLMSDVGGTADATGNTYTFDDAATSNMADASANATGTYKPTNFVNPDTYPTLGLVDQANPALSLFTGDPNGTWNLYINDDLSPEVGLITSWEITFLIPDPTNCSSAPRTVTVTVQAAIVYTTQPANRTACQNGSVTFTAAATGTITTTQWQVSINGGTTWTDIAGATTTTLTLTNVQPSQNGYRYRLALSNAGCGAVNSNAATLTVNPLPTVSLSLSPAGQTQLSPGKQTIVTVNSSPAGASYQWFINGVAEPSITGSSYAVDAHHLGTYTVRVTDVNGCVSTTSGVTFTALPTSQLFIYPNPTSGAFYVTYFMPNVNTSVTVVVIDMMGRRVAERHEVTTAPYTRFDFSNSKLAAGVYIIEFRNAGGQRLAAGQLVVMRE